MINIIYNEFFEAYEKELFNYEDFLHHVEDSPYYIDWFGVGSSHLDAVSAEKHKVQVGVKQYFISWRNGFERRLNALEKELEVLKRLAGWVEEGVIDSTKVDLEKEVLKSHVTKDDPVVNQTYFNPFTSDVYFKPLEDNIGLQRLVPIKKYMEKLISGSPFILEIGSGAGTLGFALDGSRLKQKLIGVEWASSAIKEAHKDRRGKYVEEGSVYAIPYKPRSFSVAVSLESLDTIEDQERALQEIFRVLDDKGLLIHIAILLPNPETCKRILEKEGGTVFSQYFPGPPCAGGGIYYSYSLNRRKCAEFDKLLQELQGLKKKDPDSLLNKTKAKYEEVEKYRKKHLRPINKKTYRDILKRKSKGLFDFVDEKQIGGINSYVLKKKLPVSARKCLTDLSQSPTSTCQ